MNTSDKKKKISGEIPDLLSGFFQDLDYIEFAFLFGSYANDTATKLSDIDIGIHVTGDISLMDIGALTSRLEKLIKKDVEIIILNNLYKTKPFFAHQIVSAGTPIFSRDDSLLTDFRKNTLLYYLDTRQLRKETDLSLLQRIADGRFGERNYASKN